MGHNGPVPPQPQLPKKPVGLGWPVNVSRETSDQAAEQTGKKVGLGWPA